MTQYLTQGGSERQLTATALSLAGAGFRAHVAAFRPGGIRAEELAAGDIPILDLRLESFVRPSLLRSAWRLGRYIQTHNIRLVHGFDVPSTLFGIPAARWFGVDVALSSQRAHRELVSMGRRHLLRVTDQIVDGIVVNSLSVRRQLIEEDRVPESRIHVCYNGIDTRVFSPAGRCRTPELAGVSLVIGVVCALRPEKGLQTLVRAFAEISRRHRGLQLVMVGSGPELEKLQDSAREQGVGEAVVFVPSTHEVPRWMRAMDIFVLPSLSEALSNSLMEAMACGCCPVASRVGGNPELVEHGASGLLFSAGDARELTACLDLLVTRPELRATYAKAASHKIRESFSLDASTRRMASIYRGYLEGRKVR
jgi:glycosyltransferase involved in cell wall biosynthesis